MIQVTSGRPLAAAVLAVSVASAAPAAAINLFSAQQDVQMGQQAAAEAERQLPMLRDGSVEGYVNAIVRRLAAGAPGPKFPYQAKVVNAADINAFALPGGYIYLNRGLIEAARSESELAAVIAHEMAHVAERHGTEQATKAYGAQAGVSLLGQILGGRDGRVGVAEQVVGSLGINALFLKFSRDAENEADRVGLEMLARAGYDPMAMASFFELLQEQHRRNPSSVEQFFSSHPSPANRAAKVRALAQDMGRGRGTRVGNLQTAQARLDRMPAARRQASLRASSLRRR
ncbi:MAG TPA: M48 family metallopeptidase [Vicinamibacteria bacterium]|nr:M48 family metallopeptidase [Vicinamibacteria bacterium]